jgi:dTDP-4-amino-4,6-dideoxygalactose transaminase
LLSDAALASVIHGSPLTGKATMKVPFNVPTLSGSEFDYMRRALGTAHLSGNGEFTTLCHKFLEHQLGGRALLTHSCTAALEMAALLVDIAPGDEVIMPSWTFSSTANAFVLRGAVPVFVDIRPDTLNIDEKLIAPAITARTKAICVVHYAGVGADMEAIGRIADAHGLKVIEDAAQCLHARRNGRPLGTFGHFAAFSFHETKNIIAGEGGALMVHDADAFKRAEIIWEKGTNRAEFKRREVAKYTWVDLGSSYLPSEIVAAFLYAQFEQGEAITAHRLALWHRYFDGLAGLAAKGVLARPAIPAECDHNGHIFYVLVRDAARRDPTLAELERTEVNAIIHYVPLHSAPAGIRFGRTAGPMTHTDDIAARLIRLPLHPQLTHAQQDFVIAELERLLA